METILGVQKATPGEFLNKNPPICYYKCIW